MNDEEQASIYAATSAEFEVAPTTPPIDIEADEVQDPVQTAGSYDGPFQPVDREKLKESIDQFNAEITSGSSEERWPGDFDLPARLTKNQVVMELEGVSTEDAYFMTSSELDRERSYRMPREMFEELGRPRRITVTVRPGDHLN